MSLAAGDPRSRVKHRFERSYAAGQTISEEGDPAAAFYIIQSGEVEVSRSGPAAGRTTERLGPGEFFGAMSVLLREPHRARATAVTEACVLELAAKTLEGMCIERPEIALRMMHRLAARLIEAERRLAAVGVDDLLRPVVRVLLKHAVSDGEGARIPLMLSQVAQEAGLAMLETHRALLQLFERKLIRIDEDVLHSPDADALAACVDLPE